MKTVLNIGCGEKLFKGTKEIVALNADIVKPKTKEVVQLDTYPCEKEEYSDENIYFIQTDVKQLTYIESNSIDEIRAYHLLEHINPWEVPGMLNEWKRVLKPGGSLVLEQPDMIKCCINFLNIMTTQDSKIWFNKGLQGFFGKQDPDEPYMQHKWGYWPDSTMSLLEKQGFVDVVHEESTTGAGETRDFRVVGHKSKETA